MNKVNEREIKKIVELINNSEISSIKQVASGIINIINDPESTAKDLKDNEDVREFYMGLSAAGSQKSYREVKHYRRKKRWLG